MPDPLEKALRLLALRPRTAQELDRALQRSGFPDSSRQSTLARLRELGYINDPQEARARARKRVDQGDAPRLAAHRLVAQGIGEADARSAAAEAAEGASEEELAAAALRRKLRGREPASEGEKRRLLRSLIGKGHRPSAAARALGIEWDGDDGIEDG
ncbi:MAG TPA: RecX family transcriptional regulator [Myxococcales bacterium]|nr:RecX family transcriptional regulator [Myxococcales bacterium]